MRIPDVGHSIDLRYFQAAGAGHVDVHQHDVVAAQIERIERLAPFSTIFV